jgi:hypothetical protein
MQHQDLLDRLDALEALLADRLHLNTRGGLAPMLRAAKGRLPKKALQQAGELVTVRALLASPGAAGRVDVSSAEATIAMLERHLDAVPDGKYRRRAWSALWGGIALQVLLVIVALAVVLRWRGLI